VTRLEIVASCTGLVSNYLAVRNWPSNWPIGILSCAIYVVIFAQAGLSVSVVLQLVYIAMSLYGWMSWARQGPEGGTLPIRRSTPRALVAAFLLTSVSSVILGSLLARHSGNPAPYTDAAVGMFALTATAMMARRRIEHWWFWTIVNCLGVILYARMHLYLTALLWGSFQVLCVAGIYAWRRELNARPR
jgi:nicotinamide mononucleotide transporter